MKANSNGNIRPTKPFPDFPLYAHPLGYWSKKIRGTIRHFGRWGRVKQGVLTPLEGDTWQEALQLFKAQHENIQTGRTGPGTVVTSRAETDGGLRVRDLANRFLTAKFRLFEGGELAARTFEEYQGATDRLVAQFGKDRLVDDLNSGDFESLRAELSKRWGPVRLGNEITRIKGVFKYAYDAGLIDRPVRYGPAFVKPSKSVLRRHRAAGGKRLFEAEEIHRVLASASVPMKAMILLAINAALGNSDVGGLSNSALDLEKQWIDYPRPKTGIPRRCPLWPETCDAIRAAIEVRPKPETKAEADHIFLTARGLPWVHATRKGHTDAVGTEFGKLLRGLDINGRRGLNFYALRHTCGLNFYALRHTFRTVADSTKDFPGIRVIMGHADGSIDDVYREGIDDDRLEAVAEHVRGWLWPRPIVG